MTEPSDNPCRRHVPLLSVVIPAYNEEERLADTIRAIEDYLLSRRFSSELVIVDDGSTDRTAAVAEESIRAPHSRVVRNPHNMGKGATIRRAMTEEARGRYRLFVDADNSTPIEQAGRLLSALHNHGYDVAIGSRALPKSRLEVRQPLYREAMGRFFNLLVQATVLPGIRDSQCGFKMFRADIAEAVFPRQTLEGFGFDVEVLYLARRQGGRIAEVPVRWVNSPGSRVRPLRDSFEMFGDLLRVRLRHG